MTDFIELELVLIESSTFVTLLSSLNIHVCMNRKENKSKKQFIDSLIQSSNSSLFNLVQLIRIQLVKFVQNFFRVIEFFFICIVSFVIAIQFISFDLVLQSIFISPEIQYIFYLSVLLILNDQRSRELRMLTRQRVIEVELQNLQTEH